MTYMATTDIWYKLHLQPVAFHVHERTQTCSLHRLQCMMVLSTGMDAAAGAALDKLQLSFFSVLTIHLPVADGERTQPWTSQLIAQQSAQNYTSASCMPARSALCSEVTSFHLEALLTQSSFPGALFNRRQGQHCQWVALYYDTDVVT